MKRESISAGLLRFACRQLTYLMVASAVVAIFWAITGKGSSLVATLIYSFVLGNLTALTLENVKIPCVGRAARGSVFIYVGSLLVVIPVAVTAATAIVFVLVPPISLPPVPRTSFWAFLEKAWKFPFVAGAIFGGGYLAYIATRTRLENRNRQLQETLDSGIAERELDAAELQQARDIQRGLLPKEIPQLANFAITGSWEPAKVVGGDYYDVIQLSQDRLALCIADVAGKGVSAALLMANVQAAVRAFASETTSPSIVCSKVNSVLCANIAPERFVTLFYGVLDAPSRTLWYTNAGHLRPILIAKNGLVSHLENGGALLGVLPAWQYGDSKVQLNSGDLLLLFTDGITEAMASDGEEFGEERLIQIATNFPEEPIDDLQLEILEQVKHFCNSHMSDDATLVLITALRGKSEQKQVLSRDTAGKHLTQFAGMRS